MPASEDIKLEVLNEHYNNTFEIVKDHIKRRDWMMFYVIAILILQFFEISNPFQASNAVIAFIKSSYGIEISIHKTTLEAILWFLLLVGLIRYYQTVIYINKQYKYIHHLEAQFSNFFEKDVITREGKNYLKNYPLFSDWLHLVYTWVYPVLLASILTHNIFCYWKGASFFGPYGISFLCYLMIIFSTILYLIFSYRIQKTYSKKSLNIKV